MLNDGDNNFIGMGWEGEERAVATAVVQQGLVGLVEEKRDFLFFSILIIFGEIRLLFLNILRI